MKHDPYSTARKTQDSARVDKVLGRKSGGRVQDEGDTNIHIEVNAADPKEQMADMPMPAPMPPPPVPAPPPGIGGPPGLNLPPPGPGGPALKRGGRAIPKNQDEGGAGSGVGRIAKTKYAAGQS